MTEHPEWFRKRPDGTIQYAENPPKKYQDIYPIDFETDDWEDPLERTRRASLNSGASRGCVFFASIIRTPKHFPSGSGSSPKSKRHYPDALFLAEAFTRPRVMYRLAKLGFTQSYTYFTWRNTNGELTQDFTELTAVRGARILPAQPVAEHAGYLDRVSPIRRPTGLHGAAGFGMTLGASYGIYGPAFELCENVAREPGSEEYLNSEKYEIKHWDLDRPDSLRDFIARVNRIRREKPRCKATGICVFTPSITTRPICYVSARVFAASKISITSCEARPIWQ